MWPALVAYFVLVGIRVWLNNRSLRNYLKLPLVERPAETSPLPSVSLVIPARDEERNLPLLLEGLKHLKYSGSLEILVVDDASIDRTAALAEERGARVIKIGGPPTGWLGKPFACWTGAQETKGEWLLFTDADTIHQPDSLDKTMRFALQNRAQAVSLLLQQRCFTFWEAILLPFAFQQYFISVPYKRVNVPGDPEALANGQYILVQRDAYFRAGGHEAVKSAVVEDVALASCLKAAGVALIAARGERLASVRMYRGFREVWAGFGKSASAFTRQRGARGLLTIVGTILSTLALPCAAYGLWAGSHAFELAALVTYVTAVAELSLWQFLFGTSLMAALFQPLAAVVVLLVGLDSLVRRKHVWKGRLV